MRRAALAVAVALAAAVVVQPAGVAAPGVDDIEPVSVTAAAELSATRGERWTDERIAEAIRTAKPLAPPVNAGSARRSRSTGQVEPRSIAEPAAVAGAGASALPAPATHGRMYLVNPDGSTVAWCSASVVNSGSRNLISTAAHCIHSGEGGGWHFTEAFFVPQLHGTSRPHGIFWAQRWTVWSEWIDDSDFDYDYGFVNLAARGGQNVVDVVGANGLRVNAGYDQTVVVWGYPAEAPYPGDVPYYCDGLGTYSEWFTSDIYVDCAMTPGASGGPWLVDYDYGSSLGYVNAITSRVDEDRTYTLSSYFDEWVAELYYYVD
ncbi:trypsin-like serine peptidase [Saccharothrix xinjiangensis]|uniref:Trypsin-like serine peptidase n=1 Tax=Saccharothrix xinjiangensis TaxID=204798 RepID=A0ABV9XTT6_9PSEU